MKKIIALALVLVMLFALTACGKEEAPVATEAPVVETEAETEAPAVETEAEVVAPAETEAPVVEEVAAPQTFDAGVIAAVAAIVSAAGYALSKKRS